MVAQRQPETFAIDFPGVPGRLPKMKPVEQPLFPAMEKAALQQPLVCAESSRIVRDAGLRYIDRRLVHSKCRPKTPETVSAYAFQDIQFSHTESSWGFGPLPHSLYVSYL